MAKHRKNALVRTKPLVQPAGRHMGQFVGGKHNAEDVAWEGDFRGLLHDIGPGNPFSRANR